jgi:carbonic anhydrase
MTSRMTPLLEHNEQFARAFTPVPLGLPTAQMILITCLDHRVDPALTLGLKLGDAPVLRNAGGRVTEPVIEEIAYLAFLGRRLAGGPVDGDKSVDPGFRQQAAEATGADEAALEASAVADPHITVAADVERLLASPLLPPQMSVSGHVYDVETGRVTTVLDARHLQPAGNN